MFVFKSAEFINTSLITDAIKIGKSIQNLAYPVIGPYVYKTNLPQHPTPWTILKLLSDPKPQITTLNFWPWKTGKMCRLVMWQLKGMCAQIKRGCTNKDEIIWKLQQRPVSETKPTNFVFFAICFLFVRGFSSKKKTCVMLLFVLWNGVFNSCRVVKYLLITLVKQKHKYLFQLSYLRTWQNIALLSCSGYE